MDYPVSAPSVEQHAAVAWANNYQFGAGEVVAHSGVESRAFVWSKAGAGSVDVNGTSIALSGATFVLTPWQHDIAYRANEHDPFLVAAIHIIPWHDPAVPVVLHAAHGRNDHLAGVSSRRDEIWPALRGVVRGNAPVDGRLFTAARLTVEYVQGGKPQTATLRALATVLLDELHSVVRDPVMADQSSPQALVRMQQYVLNHLHKPLSVAEVAAAGGVSKSTATRLFRQFTRASIGQWVIARRMAVARDMLRGTSASVGEVARAVGIDDPSYFSRVFRRTHGVPPRLYARRSWRL